MNRFLLLMAAVASLFITSCKKDDYSSLIGSWKGYSRSYTVLKNGQPVSPETFVRDLIKVGELEEPEDAKEMAEYIEEAKSAIYDEYLLEGDEDITLTFHNDGKLTSVFVDEKPETQHLTYSLSGKTLTIMDPSDPSETMVVTIVLLNQKEFAFTHDTSDTYRVNQSMKSLGYSMRSQVLFKKIFL